MSKKEIELFCPLINQDCKELLCMLYFSPQKGCAIKNIADNLIEIDRSLASLEESLGNLL